MPKNYTNQIYGMKALQNRVAILEAAVLQLQHLAFEEDASGDLMPQAKVVEPEEDTPTDPTPENPENQDPEPSTDPEENTDPGE